MRIGIRTLVFGVHQFLLHPLAVLVIWIKLYGLPKWHELIAIIVHDWGYWYCRDIDGVDGIGHPLLGAEIASDIVYLISRDKSLAIRTWELVLGHSRHFVKAYNDCDIGKLQFSRLLGPDKLSAVFYPWYIYIPLAWLSGELRSYRHETHRLYLATGIGVPEHLSHRIWYLWLAMYMFSVVRNPRDENYYLRSKK